MTEIRYTILVVLGIPLVYKHKSVAMSKSSDSPEKRPVKKRLVKKAVKKSAKKLPPKERFEELARSRQSDEEVEEIDLWDGSYSHLAMIGTWLCGILITVIVPVMGLLMNLSGGAWVNLLGGLAALWVGLWIWYAYRRYSVHYSLTSERFVHAEGLLWRTVDRIELIDIDDVTYVQGPVERAFGVGTIHLSSSDKTTPELSLPGIADVRVVADQIDDARRKERRSRGLHIEAI